MRKNNRLVVANLQYGGDYGPELIAAQRTGKCIFCAPDFQEKRLRSSEGWLVKHNEFPTRDRKGKHPAFQFLFVSLKHGDDAKTLSPKDQATIFNLLRWCKKKFCIEGGCFFVRDGDPLWSGRTVRHPHAHYYVPRLEKVGGTPGKFRAVPIDIPAG